MLDVVWKWERTNRRVGAYFTYDRCGESYWGCAFEDTIDRVDPKRVVGVMNNRQKDMDLTKQEIQNVVNRLPEGMESPTLTLFDSRFDVHTSPAEMLQKLAEQEQDNTALVNRLAELRKKYDEINQ